MQVFKCKMCGGTLNIENGTTVAECEFCGRKQTIPKLDDEKRANLYDRANHFRRNNDYDKAMGIYEIILNEDKTDAEAYWSILLCKYGVEYVEDPSSHKRIPTINRTQFTSILKDVDYKNALKYADGYQRDIYEEEGKEIDKIQQGILSISGKEDPFDVFICYKETDYSGRRTIDSVLAQELYSNLKKEGFKVFFARITLEDKLGVAYEPYIFAALNSAKVMVVVGSKREYFDAVWVKNEWSRYLSLIKNGEKKTLIPAYKDMDPYDLPEEFAHLQAQDMNKLGAMQDLVYGIKKIVERSNPKSVIRETVIRENSSHDKSPLIRRAYLFLEDGDFGSADDYAEKILDMDPECADAYLIKLLSELQICTLELLSQLHKDISQNAYYKKAIRFADKELNDRLIDCSRQILKNIETNRKEQIYQYASNAFIIKNYQKAIEHFSTILDYKDSVNRINECNERIEIERKERIYNNALLRVSLSNVNDIQIKASIEELKTIIDYKDSEEKVAWLQARLEKYYYDKKVAEEQAKIRAEEERLRKLREAEIRRINAEKRKQKIKKIARIGVPSALALVLILVLTFTLFIPTGKYNKANDLLNAGKYEEAMSIYEELDGFGGSVGKIATINAVQTITDGSIEKGIRDALNAGIKVNLTYEFNGGQFAQDVTSNTIRLSSPSIANETESKKTYTFTKVSDFTGFIFSKRNGYDFIKWALVSCSATVTSNDNAVNVRLTATWKAKEYSITYELNGGSIDGENPIGYNPDEPFTLTNPTKKGYTFLGWTGTDLTSETLNVSVHKGSYGDREYTANWQANTYVVTYDANGGTSSQTQDIATYDKEFVLTKAERKGYTFLGWFYGAIKCEDFDKWELTNGLSLVAKWQAISYAITYNLNGGNATNVLTYTIEDSINISTPTKKGYSFDGWTGTGLTEKTQNVCLPKGTTGDKTFNANWTANNYTLSFDVNGGDELVNKSKNVTYDETCSLPVPTRIGYDFIKWETNTGTVYSGGTWKTANNVTLIAQWKAKEYTVTYNGNGGTPAQNDVTVAYDSDFIPTTANRTGYDFVCWKYNGVEFSGGKWELTTNITLIAEWSPKTYTITYVGNGGTPSTNSQTVTYDTNPTLATAERTGYTFKGWYNGSTKYTSGNQWETANNIILTAEWTANTNTPYTVKHYQQNVNDNGYTLFDTQGLIGTSDTSITPAVMTYTGFTSPSTQATTISPDGSKIIEYYYTRNSYTLTLVTNGGTGSSITQKYQSNLDKENWSTRNGFTFGGWFIDKDLTAVFGFDDMPAQSQTIYAWWTEENKPTDFTYIENSGITISSYLGNSTTVCVPMYIGGIEVIAIKEYAFVNNAMITTIIIPDTVIEIGVGAFKGCSAIEEMTLPFVGKSEKSRWWDAVFGYIFGYEELHNAASGSTTYHSYEYYGDVLPIVRDGMVCQYICPNVYVHTNYYYVNYYYFYIPDGIKSVTITKQRNIPTAAFNNCDFIEKIYIPLDATSIDKYAFSGCKALNKFNTENENEIIIPNTVITIAENAFEVCGTVERLTLPFIGEAGNATGSIELNSFGGIISNLKNITLTDSLIIPDYSFSGLVNLEEVIFCSDITKIGGRAFANCINLKNINLPNAVEIIGDEAFYGCKSIESIEIPRNVISIGRDALRHCSSLKEIKYNAIQCNDFNMDNGMFEWSDDSISNVSVIIGNEVNRIPAYLFYQNSFVETIIFEENSNCVSIGERAFYGCRGIESIEIPINVTSIGNLAFAYCKALKEIKYNAINCMDLNYCFAFTGSGNAIDGITVIIGNLVKKVPSYLFNFLNGEEEIIYITTVIFEKDSACESIGAYAFYGCKNLTGVYITDIAAWCNISFGLYGNPLCHGENLYLNNELVTDLVIPNGVTDIGDYAFHGYNSLTSVLIPDGVVSIGCGAFDNCTNLASVLIPDSVESIDSYAFDNCTNLASIVIPDSVANIGDSAFRDCTSLVIYCEVESKPSGWHKNWNYSNRPVYWYSENIPALNTDGTAYDGNYWRYVNGVPTKWVYTPEE